MFKKSVHKFSVADGAHIEMEREQIIDSESMYTVKATKKSSNGNSEIVLYEGNSSGLEVFIHRLKISADELRGING